MTNPSASIEPGPTVQHHPSVAAALERRAQSTQVRVADAITAFAGSMKFVYLHVVVFGVWMLVLEKSPWPTLTLIVSLEAIFLSTFVMIGQNRSAAFQQQKADHDFTSQELELHHNTDLTQAIHDLTAEIHAAVVRDLRTNPPRPTPAGPGTSQQ